MKTNAKILVCFNSPVSIFSVYNGKPFEEGSELNDLSESGFSKEIGNIKKILLEKFAEVKTLAIDRNVERTIRKINNFSPDIIYNFVEAIEGVSSYEYCMAGLFQLLGYNFTGNTPSCLGNCLNKSRTKNILRAFGINTPNSISISINDKLIEKNFNLKFPVIIKLLNEDASIGISELSVVNDFKGLRKHIKFLRNTYKQDVIVEEYIDGRELNVAILGETVLPISEIKFDGLPDELPKIVTYEGKWMEGSVYYQNTNPDCPAKIDTAARKKINEIALLAYKVMGCRDYARVDIRLDNKKTPYVIEVNPNPDISVDSGFARAASAAGISHSDLLISIANFALKRNKDDTQSKAV